MIVIGYGIKLSVLPNKIKTEKYHWKNIGKILEECCYKLKEETMKRFITNKT